MFGRISAGALLALGVQGGAQAQQVYYWPAPPAAGSDTMTSFDLGTPITFRTTTEVNTKQMKPGERFYLEVAESLTYRGQIVVPAGAPAAGEVVRSEANGHFGKRGIIEVRLLYVETPWGPVRLSGGTASSGKGQALLSIGGAALTGGLGWLFVHGTSGYIRHGTPVVGYLAEPLLFQQAPPTATALTAVQPDARAFQTGFAPLPASVTGPGFTGR